MKTNPVRAKLKQGLPSIGTWLTLPDPLAARMMARVGFDWLTVELEHTPTNLETAATMFAIISASGSVPLVRVPWNTGENIKRVLDTGAWGSSCLWSTRARRPKQRWPRLVTLRAGIVPLADNFMPSISKLTLLRITPGPMTKF